MDDVVCGWAAAASGVIEDCGPEELLIEPEKLRTLSFVLKNSFNKNKLSKKRIQSVYSVKIDPTKGGGGDMWLGKKM